MLVAFRCPSESEDVGKQFRGQIVHDAATVFGWKKGIGFRQIPAVVVGCTLHADEVRTFGSLQENGDGYTPVNHRRHNLRTLSRTLSKEINTVQEGGMRDEVGNGTNLVEDHAGL